MKVKDTFAGLYGRSNKRQQKFLRAVLCRNALAAVDEGRVPESDRAAILKEHGFLSMNDYRRCL